MANNLTSAAKRSCNNLSKNRQICIDTVRDPFLSGLKLYAQSSQIFLLISVCFCLCFICFGLFIGYVDASYVSIFLGNNNSDNKRNVYLASAICGFVYCAFSCHFILVPFRYICGLCEEFKCISIRERLLTIMWIVEYSNK